MMADRSQQPRYAPRWLTVVEIAAIVGVFWLLAGWPPPDPNEAHYLCKAKHFWNPSWIPHDFFLDSHDTHLVFYVACGWLTRLLSLPATAWVGRVLSWTLVAIGLRRFSWALVPRAGWAVLFASLYALLAEHGQMAGEWVIGGFEAKSISYGLVFIGWAQWVRGDWKYAWLWLGGASSFHVVVGGWSVIAVLIGWWCSGGERPRLLRMFPWMLAGGVVALPGLLPALEVTRGAGPEIVRAADDIYVFRRLYHHLWPPAFNRWFVERHVLELLTWIVLCAFYRPGLLESRVRSVVFGSILISAIGLLLALALAQRADLAAGLMRFYWFRLGDALLPLGLASAAIGWLASMHQSRPQTARWMLAALVVLVAIPFAAYLPVRVHPTVPRADARGKVVNDADWRAACAFAATHTPPDARFLTPRSNQTFKWYAGRSEVATWKDMPQAPQELVDWWQRLEDVYSTGQSPPERPWYLSLAEEGVERLKRVGERYGAEYVLTEAEPPLALPLVYRNNSYAIYRLPRP